MLNRRERAEQKVEKELREVWGDLMDKKVLIGVCGTNNMKPFECSNVKLKVEMKSKQARVSIDYKFRANYRDAEIWFPLGELNEFSHFKMRLGEEPIQLRLLAWRHPDGPFSNEPPIPLADENLLATHQDIPLSQMYYHWKGEELTDMDLPQKIKISVTYGAPVRKGVQKGADYTFMFPMTILPRPPDQFDIVAQMPSEIRDLSSPNTRQFLKTPEGEKMSVIVVESEKIDLRARLFVINCALGVAVKPQFADPMSLVIFFSFIALIVVSAYMGN